MFILISSINNDNFDANEKELIIAENENDNEYNNIVISSLKVFAFISS